MLLHVVLNRITKVREAYALPCITRFWQPVITRRSARSVKSNPKAGLAMTLPFHFSPFRANMFPICSHLYDKVLPKPYGGGFLKKYIIDIYRGEKDNPHSIVGVIEEVGLKGRKGFTNFDELWEILNPPYQEEEEDKRIQSHGFFGRSRKHTRRDVVFFTGYSKGALSGESVSTAVITNISKSGICLLTPEVLNDGEKIFIRCSNNSPMRKAVVRWSKKYNHCHFRSGVKFEG
jgi:hypothetical protein